MITAKEILGGTVKTSKRGQHSKMLRARPLYAEVVAENDRLRRLVRELRARIRTEGETK